MQHFKSSKYIYILFLFLFFWREGGASGAFFTFISFVDEIHVSKQNSPRWDTAFFGVTSGALLFAYVPLFLVLRTTPKSRAKVCVQWRILKPPGSLLAPDRSKVVVLV